MEQQYPVTLDGKHIGKVTVQRQGLYYHFCCRCKLTKDNVCRLMVRSAAKEESLGILIPIDAGFGLDTKIPIKRVGEGELSFRLVFKQAASSETFVPIFPEEPFAYITQLKQQFLIHRDGKPGILTQETQKCV